MRAALLGQLEALRARPEWRKHAAALEQLSEVAAQLVEARLEGGDMKEAAEARRYTKHMKRRYAKRTKCMKWTITAAVTVTVLAAVRGSEGSSTVTASSEWPLSDHSVAAPWPLSDHSVAAQWQLEGPSEVSSSGSSAPTASARARASMGP